MKEKTEGLKVLAEQLDIAIASAGRLNQSTVVYLLEMARLEVGPVDGESACVKLQSAS